MSEKQIQDAILDYLARRRDVRAWRQNTGAVALGGSGKRKRFVRFGCKGAADITGIIDGGTRLEIECKSESGRLTEHQHAYGEMIRAMGGVYIVARCVEDVVGRLKAWRIRNGEAS